MPFLYPYANAGLVGNSYLCAGIGWTTLNGTIMPILEGRRGEVIGCS